VSRPAQPSAPACTQGRPCQWHPQPPPGPPQQPPPLPASHRY
jgi:hypothetical protein